MKKVLTIIAFSLVMAVSLTASFAVCAKEDITVFVDGQNVAFDVSPKIVNSRTIVPLRAIFEALGATVEWDGATSTCIATRGETTVKLTVGEETMYVNGEGKKLDVPAVIDDSRTMVPLRAVSEAFDCTVNWYGMSRTATIASDTENYTLLFSADGRCHPFSKDTVDAQLTVGWYTEPLEVLYAFDGRSKAFTESQIAPQLAVGWYLWPDLVCEQANYCVYLHRYEAALSEWLNPEINTYGENEHDDPCYARLVAKRDSVLEIMRSEYGKPYSMTDFSFTSHADAGACSWVSSSVIRFWFYNISQKDVSSITFKYSCYDASGRLAKHHSNGKIEQTATVNVSTAVGEREYVEYYFNGFPILSSVDFEIVSVTYEDGTVWNK